MKSRGHLELTNNLDLGGGQRFNDSTPAAGGAASEGFFLGGRINFVDKDTISIGTTGKTSKVRDKDDNFTIEWAGEFYLQLAKSGKNGLDTGNEDGDAWYAVHVIGDSTETNDPAGIMSKSSDSPTLPGGYDSSRRLGWVRNDNFYNVRRFKQYFTDRDRLVVYDLDTSSSPIVLSNGNATTDTIVDCSEFIPPTSSRGFIKWNNDPGTVGTQSTIAPSDWNQSTDTDRPWVMTMHLTGAADNDHMRQAELVPTKSDFYAKEIIYKTGNADTVVDIYVWGYWDSV